jgi:Protein of unknown function (DUF1579)
MTTTAAIPKPISPGAEMAQLARFHQDVTWTGTIQADGMGPGTPPMTATGRASHHSIQDGLWIVGEYQQDQFLVDGSYVLTWRLHWVAGWDPVAGQYTATHADNYGRGGVMHGRIDGDQLTFESPVDAPVRIRMTWDRTDPDRIVWRNEISAGGEPWRLVEQYDCVPMNRER